MLSFVLLFYMGLSNVLGLTNLVNIGMSLLPSKSVAVWQSEFLRSYKSRFFFSLTRLVVKNAGAAKVAERHREKLAVTTFLSMKRRGSLTLEILHSTNYLIAVGKPCFIIDLVTGERLKVTAYIMELWSGEIMWG